MKINWRIRVKNPSFWLQVYLSVFVPILTFYGLTEAEVDTWAKLFDLIIQAGQNPFIVVSSAVGIFNALVDNTTPGIGDSERALGYENVKDSKSKSVG